MSPELSHMFSIGLFTSALLGVGAWAGYFVGRRESTPRTLTAKSRHTQYRVTAAPEPMDDLLDCAMQSRQIAEQCQQLTALAAGLGPVIPPAIAEAIECLNGLSQQLARRFSQVPTAEQPRSAAAVIERDAPGEEPPARSIRLRCGLAHPGLTPAEVTEFTGATMSDTPDEVSQQRYPYHCLQTVAPWPNMDQPPAAGTAVRCHDLSIEGISFYWPDNPDFDYVLISLGQGANPKLMAAEVRQRKAVFKFGQVQYLLGCRFVKRMEEESTPLIAAASA